VAIPCDVCGEPVHEQAVKCPHCGDFTGVPVDPIAAAEIATQPIVKPEVDLHVAFGETVVSIVDAVTSSEPDVRADAELPRAIARIKR
jgi:hypothetical protein